MPSVNNPVNLVLTLVLPALSLWFETALGKTISQDPHPSITLPFTKQHQQAGNNVTGVTCEPLNLSACKALGLYSHTQLPNAFSHATQHEVSRAFNKFTPMLRTKGCGEWLSVLLCLTYAPPCPAPGSGRTRRNSKRRMTIPPAPACRQLCALAWDGCWRLFDKAGFQWPQALDCEMLPIGVEEDGRECVMKRGKLVNHTGVAKETSDIKVTPKIHTQKSKVTKISKGSDVIKENKSSKAAKKAAVRPAVNPNKVSTEVKQITKVKQKMKDTHSKVKPIHKVKDNKQINVPLKGRPHNVTKQCLIPKKNKSSVKGRRYDIKEKGDPDFFNGWADVQGQGAANDYCRVIGTGTKQRFMSCALAGSSGHEHRYVSKQGFEIGHSHTWFMRDMDGDGRDDYCRCVGRGLSSRIACMKAGEYGFYGSTIQPGDQFTFYVKSRVSCLGKTINPALGIMV